MSKATHTPGPWAAFYKHKYNEWHVSVPVSNSDMRLSIFPDGIPGDTPEEAEGNARLIAAAPDLLAVAEKTDELIQMFVGINSPDEPYLVYSLPREVQDMIFELTTITHAAIATAKGK